MSLVIDLTPSEEARISAAAKQIGIAPSEWVKKLVEANLPVTGEEDLDSKLRHPQEQNGIALMPDASTQSLFAQWAEEDARLTEAERTKNDRIYSEIEKNGIPRVQI